MVQNYSYEPLPSPNQHAVHHPLHPSAPSQLPSDPRSPHPIGAPTQTQPQLYTQSPYTYPPPPQELNMDYRTPTSPNYTHDPNQNMNVALPPMAGPIELPYGIGAPSFDTTGQVAPPGMRPRLTTSVFEEEGSLCFQVDVNGICVARREDNHMINGTKLLNVARMTRGRRDGILKAEKQKTVVKIGPMHLKGVWIPYERALALANQEKITEILYPLFVHNIGALLYHPWNAARPGPAPMGGGGQGMGGYEGEGNGVGGNGVVLPRLVFAGEEDDGRRPRL